jgi:hypothetical protein
LGGRGPPDIIVLFEQENAQSGAAEIRRGDKAIVTRAEDNDVVVGFHRPNGQQKPESEKRKGRCSIYRESQRTAGLFCSGGL